MNPELRARLLASGAVLDPAGARPLHFGDAARELDAAERDCVLVDRSDLGRVLGRGPDLLDLLHRLSTKAVAGLPPGEGRATVLTSNKGRIVERLLVHHLGEPGVLLVTGPGNAGRAMAHLGRYTFYELTGLEDATEAWCQLAWLGPRTPAALEAASLPVPAPGAALRVELAGDEAFLLGQNGFALDGAGLVAPVAAAGRLWTRLSGAVAAAGGRPAGDLAVEAWRVLRGLPTGGHELTEGHNPLEAGLWDAVDFDKGCYVGQEVVARLNTYDKVARSIRGFVLPAGAPVPAPGTAVLSGTRQVGEVTSALVPPGRRSVVVLAFVKRGFDEVGTELRIGPDEPALLSALVAPPFGEVP